MIYFMTRWMYDCIKPNGIVKQLHQDFNSEFVDIRDYTEKHEDLMIILKY